jgi:hypothetical protein
VIQQDNPSPVSSRQPLCSQPLFWEYISRNQQVISNPRQRITCLVSDWTACLSGLQSTSRILASGCAWGWWGNSVANQCQLRMPTAFSSVEAQRGFLGGRNSLDFGETNEPDVSGIRGSNPVLRAMATLSMVFVHASVRSSKWRWNRRARGLVGRVDLSSRRTTEPWNRRPLARGQARRAASCEPSIRRTVDPSRARGPLLRPAVNPPTRRPVTPGMIR